MISLESALQQAALLVAFTRSIPGPKEIGPQLFECQSCRSRWTTYNPPFNNVEKQHEPSCTWLRAQRLIGGEQADANATLHNWLTVTLEENNSLHRLVESLKGTLRATPPLTERDGWTCAYCRTSSDDLHTRHKSDCFLMRAMTAIKEQPTDACIEEGWSLYQPVRCTDPAPAPVRVNAAPDTSFDAWWNTAWAEDRENVRDKFVARCAWDAATRAALARAKENERR